MVFCHIIYDKVTLLMEQKYGKEDRYFKRKTEINQKI